MKYQITTHHPDKGLVGFSQGHGTKSEALELLTHGVEYVSDAAELHGTTVYVQATFGRGSTKHSYVGGPEVLDQIIEAERLR